MMRTPKRLLAAALFALFALALPKSSASALDGPAYVKDRFGSPRFVELNEFGAIVSYVYESIAGEKA